jgi:uncharacterized delta-60 repeat protein
MRNEKTLNMKHKLHTIIICFLIFALQGAKAQPGQNDPTFNLNDFNDGDGTGANGAVDCIAMQNNGKIIIGGSFSTYNKKNVNGIVRLNNEGTIDSTFNQGTGFNGVVNSIVIQNDGKIIIGGNFSLYNGISRNNILRINSNGTLDSTFNIGVGTNSVINSIAYQSDGKIIICGDFTTYNGLQANHITRLNSDGTIDSSFISLGTSGPNAIINSVYLQLNGKILIGGYFHYYDGIASRGIVRINSDGSVDTTFHVGTGIVGGINSIELQTDNKIIIVGSFNNYNGTSSNNIIRLNSNGNIDNTFNIGTGTNSSIKFVKFQSDGKILFGGPSVSTYNGTYCNGLVRINPGGTIDLSLSIFTGTFGIGLEDIQILSDGKMLIAGVINVFDSGIVGGITRINTNGTHDVSFNRMPGANNSVLISNIQNDGKILIGGNFTTYNGVPRKSIARLNIDGTLDSVFNTLNSSRSNIVNAIEFQSTNKIILGGQFGYTIGNKYFPNLVRLNTNGIVDTSFSSGTGPNAWVNCMVKQIDEKIIIGGNFTTYNGISRSKIARINSNGSLDLSFNPGLGANGEILSISLQPDGKIIIGGYFTSYNGIICSNLARINADGSIDATFNLGTNLLGYVHSISLQFDGKIIVGGDFTSYVDVNDFGSYNNYLIRLNSDGSLDSIFTEIGVGYIVYKTKIQSDGKILIGGDFLNINNTTVGRIARINMDGSLDATFNNSSGSNEVIYSMSLQPDGKIIIGGAFNLYDLEEKNRITRIQNCVGSSITQYLNVCEGSFVSVNNNIYSTSGIYVDTLINNYGCDSIVVTQLTVNPLQTSPTISAMGNTTICEGNSVMLMGNNGGTWSNNSTTNDISVNASGNYYVVSSNNCGSDTSNIISITVNPLPIAPSISAIGSTNLCQGNSLILTGNNNGIWNNGSTASDTLILNEGAYFVTTTNSCGSTVSNTINVNQISVDTAITVGNATFLANASNATFQWLLCNGTYSPIPSETNQTYTPTQLAGFYAVEVTQNGCIDTSACYPLILTVLSNSSKIETIELYPNPATNQLTVDNGQLKIGTFTILNTLGQIVFYKQNCNALETIDVSGFATGIYIVRTNQTSIKFIKQ